MVSTAAAVAGLILWLVRETGPLAIEPAPRLEQIVRNEVAGNIVIKSCVIAVAKGDGSLSWSGAAGVANDATQVAMTKDTPIYVASVTKLYHPRAMIQGIQVYAGNDYSDQVTVGDLLSHRSGIADYYNDKTADGKSVFDLFLEDPKRHWTVDETIARARGLEAHFPAGMRTAYSDTNFQLLGRIIEGVIGQPLHAVYDSLLFRPLGLRQTWLVGHRPEGLGSDGSPADVYFGDKNITLVRSNGSYWADGGLVSTASEISRARTPNPPDRKGFRAPSLVASVRLPDTS